MSILRVDGIEASYGAVRALRGISLNVAKGAMVALLGANGAGKSTMLKAISGMVKPASGSIEFDGERLSGRTPTQIVRMGIAHVPEGRKIFKDLTVFENLRMGAYTRKDSAAIKDDLAATLQLFPRLQERQKQLGGSLSGGEQQMLAIGRGLMARPKLLMLDEPSLGLAPLIVADIFAALKKINQERGTTMLIVEQNVHIALKNTVSGYVLQVGRVAIEGDSENLRQHESLVESYMGVHE
jgi:branched-chain amino acid transport system ATP-binding protein